MASWKKTRKLLNDLHLWMGVGSGLILFVVCLTGTIYTFRTEIEEVLQPEKYRVIAPDKSEPLTIEALIPIIRTELGDVEITSVSIPAERNHSYRFYVKKEGERRGTNYLVNPYTGALLGDTTGSTADFFMVIFRLHRWLLLDTSVGRPIVGWATIIFVFLILSGLVIWVPQKAKSWKQGLKIKWSANWKRINHDLHNALGFYSAILLLIMSLTGLQWSFDWYRSGLRTVLGVDDSSQGEATLDQSIQPPAQTGTVLPYDSLLTVADIALDYHGSYRISLPDTADLVVSMAKYSSGFFARAASDQLTIDRYTGTIVIKELFSEKPFNMQIARSIKALHTGDVFGTFSKILYFISCLIATSLPVTGTIIWINKLKKKRQKARKIMKVPSDIKEKDPAIVFN